MIQSARKKKDIMKIVCCKPVVFWSLSRSVYRTYVSSVYRMRSLAVSVSLLKYSKHLKWISILTFVKVCRNPKKKAVDYTCLRLTFPITFFFFFFLIKSWYLWVRYFQEKAQRKSSNFLKCNSNQWNKITCKHNTLVFEPAFKMYKLVKTHLFSLFVLRVLLVSPARWTNLRWANLVPRVSHLGTRLEMSTSTRKRNFSYLFLF